MIPHRVRDCMTAAPYTVQAALPLEVARRFLADRKIRHLPVLKDRQVVGMVADLDVQRAAPSPTATVGDVMRPPELVNGDAPLSHIVRDMARRKIGSAVVVMERGKVAGIFTMADALLLLGRILEEAHPTPAAAPELAPEEQTNPGRPRPVLPGRPSGLPEPT